MNYSFHPEANTEFHDAIEYYESCQAGLGIEFSIEVRSAIQRITKFPEAWPVLEEDVRRCLMRKFPFGILYSIEPDGLFILAVMHLHRDPEYWKNR